MNWIKKIFGKKEQPKKEERKSLFKQVSGNYVKRDCDDDYHNSLSNPLNVLSPFSPLNPINQMNMSEGFSSPASHYTPPSYDHTPTTPDSSSYDHGSSYQSSSDSSSYDSSSSFSSDSSSVDTGSGW